MCHTDIQGGWACLSSVVYRRALQDIPRLQKGKQLWSFELRPRVWKSLTIRRRQSFEYRRRQLNRHYSDDWSRRLRPYRRRLLPSRVRLCMSERNPLLWHSLWWYSHRRLDPWLYKLWVVWWPHWQLQIWVSHLYFRSSVPSWCACVHIRPVCWILSNKNLSKSSLLLSSKSTSNQSK